jgi:hypothetical protein
MSGAQMLLRIREQCEVWRFGKPWQSEEEEGAEGSGPLVGREQDIVCDHGKAARLEAKRQRRAARKLQASQSAECKGDIPSSESGLQG